MDKYVCWPFHCQPRKMVKHTQTTRRILLMNCLSVFNHFVGLTLKELVFSCSVAISTIQISHAAVAMGKELMDVVLYNINNYNVVFRINFEQVFDRDLIVRNMSILFSCCVLLQFVFFQIRTVSAKILLK